jgi:hypothetical protein
MAPVPQQTSTVNIRMMSARFVPIRTQFPIKTNSSSPTFSPAQTLYIARFSQVKLDISHLYSKRKYASQQCCSKSRKLKKQGISKPICATIGNSTPNIKKTISQGQPAINPTAYPQNDCRILRHRLPLLTFIARPQRKLLSKKTNRGAAKKQQQKILHPQRLASHSATGPEQHVAMVAGANSRKQTTDAAATLSQTDKTIS